MKKKPYKIFFFSNKSWNLFKFRLPLVKELQKNKVFNVSISSKDSFASKIKKEFDKSYFLDFTNNNSKLFIFIKNIIILYKIIKKENPDYILSYTIKCNLISIIFSKFIKIKTYINVTGLGSVFLKKSFLYLILKKIISLLYRSHDRIIFQNIEDVKIIYGKDYKNYNYNLISGTGVDINFYKPFLKKIRQNDINFYMISRIIADKGVLEYFKAAEKCLSVFPNVKFNYVGNFDFENPSSITKEKFYYFIKKLDINYYKFSDDIRSKLKKADCIILPSYREGMSRVLLEAASMEIPIITTRVAGCKEIVKHGYNGFLCKSKSANDLTKSIAKFIKLTKKAKINMGRNSRILIKKNFDQKSILKKYLKLLDV